MMMDSKTADELAEVNARMIAASVDAASTEAEDKEIENIVVRTQHSTAVALREIIDAAKAGNKQALNKIRVFSTVKDPNLAARLALMNRAQRQKYFAEIKKAGRATARKAKRQKPKDRAAAVEPIAEVPSWGMGPVPEGYTIDHIAESGVPVIYASGDDSE